MICIADVLTVESEQWQRNTRINWNNSGETMNGWVAEDTDPIGSQSAASELLVETRFDEVGIICRAMLKASRISVVCDADSIRGPCVV